MQFSFQRALLVLLVAVVLIPDTSSGQLLRRRRRSGGGGALMPAISSEPFIGLTREKTRRNRDEYDYNWAATRQWHKNDAKRMLFSDKIQVRLRLQDKHLSMADQLVVRATWAYLHKSKTKKTVWLPLQHVGEEIYFELTGLEEARVVRIETELFARSDLNAEASEETNRQLVSLEDSQLQRLTALHVPYYGVTSSTSNEEWKRRARIVSFSFSQWYADEAYGGRCCNYDCYSFYKSSAAGELEGFQLKSVSRNDVPRLSREGKRFHGDYLIMSGHYGMALCYDEDRNHFWTIEGNYALSGPYRVNIDPYYHGLNIWSSIMTIATKPPIEEAEVN